MDIGVILAGKILMISSALEVMKDVGLAVLDFEGAFDNMLWWGLLAHLLAVGVHSKTFKLIYRATDQTKRSSWWQTGTPPVT